MCVSLFLILIELMNLLKSPIAIFTIRLRSKKTTSIRVLLLIFVTTLIKELLYRGVDTRNLFLLMVLSIKRRIRYGYSRY